MLRHDVMKGGHAQEGSQSRKPSDVGSMRAPCGRMVGRSSVCSSVLARSCICHRHQSPYYKQVHPNTVCHMRMPSRNPAGAMPEDCTGEWQ